MRVPKRVMASLLVSAVLVAPGSAFAAAPSTRLAADLPVTSAPAAPAVDAEQAQSPGALVAPKLTREQATEVATRLFKIPASLGKPTVNLSQTQEQATWGLHWSTPSDQPDYAEIAVSVDAVTGTVLSYSAWKSETGQPLQLSLTRDEARAKAQGWFDQLVPSGLRASMKPVDPALSANYWGGSVYWFNWERHIQGHPLAGDGVAIAIDLHSGELTSYALNRRPSAADLQLPEKMLSPEEAAAAYAKGLELELQYEQYNKPGTDEFEWRLVYRPTADFPHMNQEGAMLDNEGEPLEKSRNIPVPAPAVPYRKPAQPLTAEQALAAAQAVSGRKDAPISTQYSEYGAETKRATYSYTWVTEATESAPRVEIRVSVDAETGLVADYSNWTETRPLAEGEKPPVSYESAQQKAIQFVRTHRPDLAGSVELIVEEPWWLESDYQPTGYYMSFRELKNGIPVAGSRLSVTVNAVTGAIEYFWASPVEVSADSPMPPAEGLISAEEAAKAFLASPGIQTAWVSFWDSEAQKQGAPVLLWQPVPHLNVQAIDARTGAPLDWQGRDLIEAQRYPSDIKGHAAEREIELLWSRGVLDLQDGKFNPADAVKAEDLVRWVVLARGLRPLPAYDFSLVGGKGAGMAMEAARNANSAYFGAALRSGIITGDDLALLKDLTGPVSRELASLWAVRAMGYGRIADMEARIEMAFADKGEIGAQYQNAVAILSGLGIVSADAEGKFGPQQSLTRGDAARMLFAVTAQ